MAAKERRIMPPDFKGGGEVRLMCMAEGYVMARRPGCLPFIVSAEDWASWTVADSR